MKTLLLISALALLSGCAATGHHITDSRSAWINIGHGPMVHAYWCEAKEGQKPVCERPIRKD